LKGRRFGRLSHDPVVSSQPGTPFAFVFDNAGRLVLTHAGTSALATYSHGEPRDRPNGQQAAWRIVEVNGRFYVSNAGTSNVTIYDGGAWPAEIATLASS
jgi:hypothetical protein